jgi:ATP-binding cassette, subfamily B, bacterial CvaB/MchF/RaxB
MVASAHGSALDLSDLRRRFPTSVKGASLKQLVAQASSVGFDCRPLRLEVDELSKLSRPSILHWGLNHFVVLKSVSRRKVTILDPAIGERRVTFAEVSRSFTGVALELSKAPDFKPELPRPRLRLRQLSGRIRGLWWALAQILGVALVLQFFAVLAPLLNQLVVDDVIASHDHDLLSLLVFGFALLLIAQSALGFARSWMVLTLGQALSLQWVGNVFSHLTRLPVQWFEQRHIGDITSRFSAAGTIQRTVTTALVEAVIDGLLAMTTLAMMFLYAPALSWIVLAAVCAYGALRWASYRPLREASAERLVLSAKENTHFLETVRAITPLKLFGQEEERRARWKNLLVDVQNRDARTAKLNIVFSTANAFIFGTENLLVLWFAAKMIMAAQSGGAEAFTIGMMFAFISYKGQFTGRVSALIDYAVQLRMLGLHAERLADIALAAPECDTALGNLPENDLTHLQPTVELRDVSYRYGFGEPWVLRHASMTISANESVAITGASGAGKTTLLKVLLGILPPSEGEVLYGGIPVRQLGLANVRRCIGSVMQEDVLLTGSLADNIAFFDVQPDSARIEACARLAQVHAEIVKMPMGYHTLCGDLGSGLSGGQKQRVLLARALYKQPRVLALDEATSHLDLGNERAVTQALAQMQLTRVVIAHRPETIAGAQRVVQLRDGQVVDVVRAVTTAPAGVGLEPPQGSPLPA